MKKVLIGIFLSVVSMQSFSAEMLCGDIKRTRVWAHGGDTYGVWIEYKSNPPQCPGGFYVPHGAVNKDLVYSTVLAAKMASEAVCIQVINHDTDIANRCRLQYVMHQ